MIKLYKSIYQSPFGTLLLVSDDQYLLKVIPSDDLMLISETSPPINKARDWLDAYFAGVNPPPEDLPIHLNGTTFQLKCWQLLRQIPYGTTCTYKAIAMELAKESPTGRMSSQAVGQAIHKNPIAIIIPCHRVIGSDGRLTGYAGGLDLKHSLLLHEKAI